MRRNPLEQRTQLLVSFKLENEKEVADYVDYLMYVKRLQVTSLIKDWLKLQMTNDEEYKQARTK